MLTSTLSALLSQTALKVIAADPPAKDFLTDSSIMAFGGATIAVLAVSNTMRAVFKWTAVGIPFVMSLLLSYAIADRANLLDDLFSYVLAGVNGCLLFCSAAGTQEVIASQGQALSVPKEQRGTTWRSSWFKR